MQREAFSSRLISPCLPLTAMRNVEFKAELRDIALARTIARALGAAPVVSVQQTDTYFRIPEGRLKKRETPDEATEWIFYDRPDRAAAKVSRYVIYTEAEALERFGRYPLPVRVVVRKMREVYLLDTVRIHLDYVEGLGEFIEFEALLTRGHGVGEGRAKIAAMRRDFAPAMGEPVARGYADLMADRADEQVERMTDEG